MTRTNFEDRAAAARDIEDLRNVHGMTDQRFWLLHHRKNLEVTGGRIPQHLKYLSGDRPLKAHHQQTARRFAICLDLLRAGWRWPDAIAEAESRAPGARSFER